MLIISKQKSEKFLFHIKIFLQTCSDKTDSPVEFLQKSIGAIRRSLAMSKDGVQHCMA